VDELTIKVGAAVPVPLRVVVCGEPLALSATEREAVKLVAEAGVKVTEMVQLASAASVWPQVVAAEFTAKSVELVPVMLMLVIESGAFPVFISVAVCAALATPTVEVKVRVDGVSEAPGTAAAATVTFTAAEVLPA
jgi:hypothetical protein